MAGKIIDTTPLKEYNKSMFDQNIEIKRRIIEKIKFNISIHISRNIFENIDISVIDDFITNDFVYQISLLLAGKTGFEKIPATWFQHFKQNHFPQWVKKKWPVQTTKIPTTYICPHLDTSKPGRHIEWLECAALENLYENSYNK